MEPGLSGGSGRRSAIESTGSATSVAGCGRQMASGAGEVLAGGPPGFSGRTVGCPVTEERGSIP